MTTGACQFRGSSRLVQKLCMDLVRGGALPGPVRERPGRDLPGRDGPVLPVPQLR